MKEHILTDVGLWIDHREAVIVMVSTAGEKTKHIDSNMEKHVRFSGAAAEGGAGEDVRDRKFDNHLNIYYNAVIAEIRDTKSIQVFGPGEAKGELQKRLKENGMIDRVINVETVDKMTERQIAVKVRDRLNDKHALQVNKTHRSE
jgi:hypothetical protein